MLLNSLDYLKSAEKMIKMAKEKYKERQFASELSYIEAAKQDIDNALYYAKRELEMKVEKLGLDKNR